MSQLNATNRKSIRVAEKSAAERESSRLQFLRAAMDTPQGRLWFYDLLAACEAFTINPTFDPNRDYFALGQRNIGMRVWADLQTHCPDQYLQMMREENDRQLVSAARQQPGSPDPRGSDPRPVDEPADHDAPTGSDFDPYGHIGDLDE